jgi:hypothetical protein
MILSLLALPFFSERAAAAAVAVRAARAAQAAWRSSR